MKNGEEVQQHVDRMTGEEKTKENPCRTARTPRSLASRVSVEGTPRIISAAMTHPNVTALTA